MTSKRQDAKGSIQSGQYAFPYHYLPQISDGACARDRWLEWGWEYAAYQQEVVETVRSLSPSSVLDVGCGDGYFLNSLQASVSPAVRLQGIDLDERAIRFAQAFSSGPSFTAEASHDVTDRFDVVVCVEVLEHIPDSDTASFCASLLDRARSGGTLVLTVPSDATPLIPKHYRHYDEGLLQATLSEGARLAGRTLSSVHMRRIFAPTKAYTLCRKLLCNRYWRFASPLTDRAMWRWSTALAKSAAPGGKHIVLSALVD